MTTEKKEFWKKYKRQYNQPLDPIDRLSELIYGVIMTLTFTCTISLATAGQQEIKTALWAALGCNTAWGIIDALVILMGNIFDRGKRFKLLSSLHKANDTQSANAILKEAFPPIVAEIIKPNQLDNIRKNLLELPEPPKKAFVNIYDIKNAIIVFLLVVISTFPVAFPFIIISEPIVAHRLSNAVALLLLFSFGFFLGRKTYYNPTIMGLGFMILGGLLVLMTIALGG
ncbi:MAG: hypothetical protein FJ216_00215 [Ignavibacteria bacterium]|nr:hypothetical protein [Ignavibacteria bacterium]